jgi:hypothetical protein
VIFNEDESAMSVGTLFDVLVVPKPTTRVFNLDHSSDSRLTADSSSDRWS